MSPSERPPLSELDSVRLDESVPPPPFDVRAPFSSADLGLTDLERENMALTERCMRLSTEVGSLTRERDRYLEAVGWVQARCTEQELELRTLRPLRPLRELSSLWLALSVAREKHPEGTCLHDLFAELAEVTKALGYETEERFRQEAIDVAVCGLRIALGGDDRTTIADPVAAFDDWYARAGKPFADAGNIELAIGRGDDGRTGGDK